MTWRDLGRWWPANGGFADSCLATAAHWGNSMNWRARSALISCLVAWRRLPLRPCQRRGVSDAPDQARHSLCGGRADRYFWPAGGRISRQGSQASGVRREQGRCARRHCRRNGGACRARWLHAVRPSGSVIVLNPLLYKKLSYDPAKDFRMLALVTEVPVVLGVHPSVPAKTVAEFVAYAKQNPASSISALPEPEALPILPPRCSSRWPASR